VVIPLGNERLIGAIALESLRFDRPYPIQRRTIAPPKPLDRPFAKLKKRDRLQFPLKALKLADRKPCDSSDHLKWDIFLEHL
jgi:hypothetical protein